MPVTMLIPVPSVRSRQPAPICFSSAAVRARVTPQQVVVAAGIAGRFHAELARRIAAEEIALHHAVFDHVATVGRTPQRQNGLLATPFGMCGSSLISTCGENTGAPRLSSRERHLR